MQRANMEPFGEGRVLPQKELRPASQPIALVKGSQPSIHTSKQALSLHEPDLPFGAQPRYSGLVFVGTQRQASITLSARQDMSGPDVQLGRAIVAAAKAMQ